MPDANHDQFSEPGKTTPQETGAQRRAGLLIVSIALLLTVAALFGIFDSSARAMIDSGPPTPLEIEDGDWAGWWLDGGWTVNENGALLGDTSPFAAQPLDDVYLRYAFPPVNAPNENYRLTFDLTLTRGTLYLGARANWHPETANRTDCGSLVFPLHDPLFGQALDRQACQVGGIRNEAVGLARPYSSALHTGQRQQVQLVVQNGGAQFITLDTVIYDVNTRRDQGGFYVALGPQTIAAVTNLTVEVLE